MSCYCIFQGTFLGSILCLHDLSSISRTSTGPHITLYPLYFQQTQLVVYQSDNQPGLIIASVIFIRVRSVPSNIRETELFLIVLTFLLALSMEIQINRDKHNNYMLKYSLFRVLSYINLVTPSIFEFRVVWAHLLNLALINCLYGCIVKQSEATVSCFFT